MLLEGVIVSGRYIYYFHSRIHILSATHFKNKKVGCNIPAFSLPPRSGKTL